jgi:uncharacterized repeat protein (TIGR01451 family)
VRTVICIGVLLLAVALAGISAAAPSGSVDLKIAKTASPDPVGIGAALTYAIRVESLGPDAASGVTVTDRIPKGVDLVSATSSSGQCTARGRKVSCALGGFGAPGVDYGGPATVTLVVVPRQLGTIVNTASVKGGQKDPIATNNRATATTRVVGITATCRGVPATVIGTAADNALLGSGGRDVIAALGGNDTIRSLAGRDLVCAGGGDDRVGSGSAADRVFGGTGSDHLLGRGGPDLLRGNAGNDTLKGDRGDDRLHGGRNFDRCRGGAGEDSIGGCER